MPCRFIGSGRLELERGPAGALRLSGTLRPVVLPWHPALNMPPFSPKPPDPPAAAPPGPAARGLAAEPFQPTSLRRRLLIAGLALGMTLTLGLAMLTPHAAAVRAALALKWAEPPRCAPGQLRGCVGGAMDIVVLPPSAPASMPAAAASSALRASDAGG